MSGFDLLRSYGVPAAAHRVDVIKAVGCAHQAVTDGVIDGVEQDVDVVSLQAVHNVLSPLSVKGLFNRAQPVGHPARCETRLGDNRYCVVTRMS